MLTLLLFDNLSLYILLNVAMIATLVAVEQESPGWSTGILIGTLIVLQWFSPIRPLSFIIAYPSFSLLLLLGYFVCGIGWIFIKWTSYVYTLRDKAKSLRERHPANVHHSSQQVPEVADHKSKLYLWWAFWPASLLRTIINDPLKRLWRFVYSRIGSSLQNIANRAFHD